MIINRRFWTFNTLVNAFLDLFVAYFLLCGATIALFALKFLGFFGFNLPTLDHHNNNNSIFGVANCDIKTLLVDHPSDKILDVQSAVTKRFPFDKVFVKAQDGILNQDLSKGLDFGDGFLELEGEASCGSKTGGRNGGNGSGEYGIKIKKERGFDMKGKGGLNYRLRGSFRRRRKAVLDTGKQSFGSSSTNWVTCCDDQQSNNEADKGDEVESQTQSLTTMRSDGRVDHGIVFGDIENMIPVNEADKDKMIVLLTRELEESRAGSAALYVELEKERNAAATAADEAMSMILRLQEEKASVDMELRQYQRMIEEKSAYDEEEMNILKEIVLRREREKHFLEKEVDVYRRMIHGENYQDQFNSGSNEDFTQDPEFMLHQLNMSIAEKKNSRMVEDDDFFKSEEPEKTIAIVGEDKGLEKNESRGGEADSPVYDVHVIDNDTKSTGNKRSTDRKQSGSEASSGLPPMSGSKSSLRRNSTSAIDHERTKLDTEVEWLRERLKVVQEGREKLNVSVDSRDQEGLQLQLLEDIGRQLQEIRMLTAPRTSRQASLPLPSAAKGLTKKKRYRSVSSGHAKSS